MTEPEPDPSHEFTCPGKQRYLKRSYAKAWAKEWRRRTGDVQQPYRCTACGCWHTGHKPKQRRDSR